MRKSDFVPSANITGTVEPSFQPSSSTVSVEMAISSSPSVARSPCWTSMSSTWSMRERSV